MNNQHTLTGKISCLPHDLRQQLNQRLRDGQRSPQILPWLNELPAVKEILAAQFGGKPLNRQNLANWRHSGYQEWLQEQSQIDRVTRLAEYASRLSHAGNDSLVHGVATLAAAKLLQHLDTLLASDCSPDDLIKVVTTLKPLLTAAQTNARIKLAQERHQQREQHNKINVELARERINQKDGQLTLMRDMHERDVTAIALRLLGDQRAKEIEAAPISHHEKIELLGRWMFNRTWRHRPLPTPGVPQNPDPTPGPVAAEDPNPMNREDSSSLNMSEPALAEVPIQETQPSTLPLPGASFVSFGQAPSSAVKPGQGVPE
jgi:hypothetical protein